MIEVALAGVALVVAFRATGGSLTGLRVEWHVARRLLQDSWPLALSGMFVLLTMQLDKIIIGEMSGNTQVGIYSVASQISSIWYMVPMIVGASIAPSIARSHAARDQNYDSNLQKVYTALTHISVATAIAVFFLSGPVIGILFGAEYQGAGPVLAVHIWGAIFVFHVSIRTRALIAEGKQRFITAIAALTLLSSVLLNLLLIGRYGALGAAYASLASWALCATVFPAIWPETRQSVVMFLVSFKAFRR
jgi:PST family polysaccharide transporter